ncbi:shikimate kinase [Botrimarina sp.]|uniref:shikimate kinase n=1 Tax=Botrimarina sp. TaxID=2795802 RepID=UPI0032EB8C9E
MPEKINVVLIGMPGSGKSTVGVVLAKRTRRGFVDADLVIQQAEGRTLQEIVDAEGAHALRAAEERAVLSLAVRGHVIATGGSAVYSREGMEHLAASGRIVYLAVDLPTLQQRLGDYSQRGVAMRAGQSLADLLAERDPLYRRWADATVDATGPTTEAVCERIEAALDG